jgi:hypothetical protein
MLKAYSKGKETYKSKWKKGGKGDRTCRVRELCSSAHMEAPNT